MNTDQTHQDQARTALATQSTTEAAKEIRQTLKKLGYTSRQVSVRAQYFSMGSEITVKIKDITCNFAAIHEIAHAHARIHRCAYSGDILGGGNRYIDVSWDYELFSKAAAPFKQFIESMPEGAHITPFEDVTIIRCDHYTWQVNDKRIGDAEAVAFKIAKMATDRNETPNLAAPQPR